MAPILRPTDTPDLPISRRADDMADGNPVLTSELAAELVELRQQIGALTEEINRLKTEKAQLEAVCCPWWAQAWHRPH
jgi:uncharacterized small protein (DUF1192 family)